MNIMELFALTKKYVNNKISQTKTYYVITEDMFDLEFDDTKGVAPFSTSYSYTNITIHKDAGVIWSVGSQYRFILDTKVSNSTYRNVRVRIGNDNDNWIPLCMYNASVAAGSSYFIKAQNTIFVYLTNYYEDGALHWADFDTNTTYAYLVNSMTNVLKVDDKGYAAKSGYCFATTPLSDENGVVEDERYSSLVSSSSSGATKGIITPASNKFYIDRQPVYLSTSSYKANTMISGTVYQEYSGADLRYIANTSSSWLTVGKKVFLYLKDFDASDMSFKADSSIGAVLTLDKIQTKFGSEQEPVYLYLLGHTSASTYYTLFPMFTSNYRIYKYTPTTKKLEIFK